MKRRKVMESGTVFKSRADELARRIFLKWQHLHLIIRDIEEYQKELDGIKTKDFQTDQEVGRK